MSLERTALRLAATMALANGFAEPYPTIAQNRVFDSRQDPIEGLKANDVVPIVVLYTDTAKGDMLSHNNGGPPFEQHCHLVLELSLAAVVQGDGDQAALGLILPQTAPELDAALDAFEAQVSRVFRDCPGVWGAHLRNTFLRIESWQSERYIDREANIRLAARQITAVFKLPLEEMPEVTVLPSDTEAPTVEPYVPAPLGPLLTAIAGSDSPYAPTAAAIEEMLLANSPDTPIVLPALERIRLIEANQAEKNNVGVAAGPRGDGVAEVTFPTP